MGQRAVEDVWRGRGGPFLPWRWGTDGGGIEFLRARVGFSEAVRPCLRAGPGRTGGEGGGAVLSPAGGVLTAESGPRSVPVWEGADRWASGRLRRWRGRCRGRAGGRFADRARGQRESKIVCGRTCSSATGRGAVWPDKGGPAREGACSPAAGRGTVWSDEGGRLRARVLSLLCSSPRGLRGHRLSPAPLPPVGAVSLRTSPAAARRLSLRTGEGAEICAGICRQPIAIAGQFLYH